MLNVFLCNAPISQPSLDIWRNISVLLSLLSYHYVLVLKLLGSPIPLEFKTSQELPMHLSFMMFKYLQNVP